MPGGDQRVDDLAGADPAEGGGRAHDDREGERDGGGVAGGDDPLLPAPLEGGARQLGRCPTDPSCCTREGASEVNMLCPLLSPVFRPYWSLPGTRATRR